MSYGEHGGYYQRATDGYPYHQGGYPVYEHGYPNTSHNPPPYNERPIVYQAPPPTVERVYVVRDCEGDRRSTGDRCSSDGCLAVMCALLCCCFLLQE